MSQPKMPSNECEIKLSCSGGKDEKKGSCEKPIKIEEAAKLQQEIKICKSAVEGQATLNKKPCGSATCDLARPDQTDDPKARIDKTKPACVNYENCDEDDDEVPTEDRKLESGCLDYEDCNEYIKEEKRRIKRLKEEAKQRKKEMAKAKK